MKLFEVAPLVRKLGRQEETGEDIYDYRNRLTRKEKMKKMGSGEDATVYQHPKYKTVVAKVSDEGFNGKVLRYIRYVAQHQDNPYVPKIYDIRRFRSRNGNEYFIAFMEKLPRHWGDVSKENKKAILQKHIGDLANDREMMGYLSHAWEMLASRKSIAKMKMQHRRLGKPSQHLIDIMMFIASYPNDLDVHANNVMMRANGHPVITDPWA